MIKKDIPDLSRLISETVDKISPF